MRRAVAATGVLATLPVAAAVVIQAATPAAADTLINHGVRSYKYDPSPTFVANYLVCDLAICIPNWVPWWMADSSDWKEWQSSVYGGDYFVFWNDHIFMDQQKVRFNSYLQPDGHVLSEHFNQDGVRLNVYVNQGDDCLVPGGDWFICGQTKNEDLRGYLGWAFFEVGVPFSDDPSIGVYGDFYNTFQFK
jgi:hypothetical protein